MHLYSKRIILCQQVYRSLIFLDLAQKLAERLYYKAENADFRAKRG